MPARRTAEAAQRARVGAQASRGASRPVGGVSMAPETALVKSKPIQQPREPSPLERHLLDSMRAAGLPEPEREFRFHPTRKFRIDFAWPAVRLAVEVEGGLYRGGGHTSVAGLKRDLEKGNLLTLGGWRLLRFHGDQVRSGEATETIRQALAPADATGEG